MGIKLKYIQNKHKQILESQDFIVNGVRVIVKDKIENDVSIIDAIEKVTELISKKFLKLIDTIYIGNFKFLNDRKINASYENGALFISNIQDDLSDLVDDLIHETSHALEEKYQELVYNDGRIQREFLSKRYKLFLELKAYNYKVNKEDFLNLDYSKDFDFYLYDKIGYERLQFFTLNLFPNVYSITSLREYFASGFETYFLKGPEELKMAPVLLEKIQDLEEIVI